MTRRLIDTLRLQQSCSTAAAAAVPGQTRPTQHSLTLAKQNQATIYSLCTGSVAAHPRCLKLLLSAGPTLAKASCCQGQQTPRRGRLQRTADTNNPPGDEKIAQCWPSVSAKKQLQWRC